MYLQPIEGELELSEVEKLTSIVRSCMAGPDSVRPEGEYFVPVDPNSFGIPSVETCPGKTDYCEMDCYAVDSERRTATHLKLQRNLDILEGAETVEGMTEKLCTLVDGYNIRADRLGIPVESRFFRIHWSGDFFSIDYAQAWADTIRKNPDMKFYVYTRSFQPDVNVLPVLSGLDNLDLFISVDCQNVEEAAKVLPNFPTVKVAYLVDYLEDSEQLIDRLGRGKELAFRAVACPENMRDEKGDRKLSVISKRGGACARCTYCINKPENWDVIFVKTGLRHLVLPFPDIIPIEIMPKPKKADKIVQPAG